MAAPTQLHFKLMGHSFKVACAEEDKPTMQEAARMVESKNEDLRKRVRVADGERAALMTALMIAFELRKGELARPAADAADERLAQMCAKIDAALANAGESA